MTYSIVALDSETGDIGIAVQSKFPSVGSLVPWINLNAGAVATQALANVKYGPQGLDLMRAGATAEHTLNILLAQDDKSSQRQVGIVDRFGNAVAHTGEDCYDWAGHLVGDGVTCQGNILIEGTIDAMMDTYLSTKADLPERLMSALEAGQEVGGDSRGQQSANLLVYREEGGYGGGSDVWIDVRVDDHQNAVAELRRVFEIYSITLLEREEPGDVTELDNGVLNEIAEILQDNGYLETETSDRDVILETLDRFYHTENFENKIRDDGYIWNSILNYMRKL